MTRNISWGCHPLQRSIRNIHDTSFADQLFTLRLSKSLTIGQKARHTQPMTAKGAPCPLGLKEKEDVQSSILIDSLVSTMTSWSQWYWRVMYMASLILIVLPHQCHPSLRSVLVDIQTIWRQKNCQCNVVCKQAWCQSTIPIPIRPVLNRVLTYEVSSVASALWLFLCRWTTGGAPFWATLQNRSTLLRIIQDNK